MDLLEIRETKSRLKKYHRSWVLCFAWGNHRSSIPARCFQFCLQSWQKNLQLQEFSVIIQVQERLPAKSNPSHEQSTLMLLISEFIKKLPDTESKFTMWTLKIKLLMSLRKVLRGHGLKCWATDLDWYHQGKSDLSFFVLDSVYCTVLQDFGTTATLSYKISVQDFVAGSSKNQRGRLPQHSNAHAAICFMPEHRQLNVLSTTITLE